MARHKAQDRTRPRQNKKDKARQCKKRQNNTRYDKTSQSKTGQGMTKQGKTRQEHTRHDTTGHQKAQKRRGRENFNRQLRFDRSIFILIMLVGHRLVRILLGLTPRATI